MAKLITVARTVAPEILSSMGSQARLSVTSVGALLGVSRQRASKLLRDGRIEGAHPAQDSTWWIPTPVRLKPGARGPVSGYARAGYSPRRPRRLGTVLKGGQ